MEDIKKKNGKMFEQGQNENIRAMTEGTLPGLHLGDRGYLAPLESRQLINYF